MSITFIIHDSIKVCLQNALPDDVKAVSQQLGIQSVDSNHDPDILVTYLDELSSTVPARHLARGQAAYTEQDFLVMEGDKRAAIPLEQVGEMCEIKAEHGIGSIPLLISIINLTALSKGILPLHASAFAYENVGVLASGWPKGGKTSVLFSFLSNKARFVSDDWSYLYPDGQIQGLSLPINMHDWQLDYLPQYRVHVSRRKHLTMESVKKLDQFVTALSGSSAKKTVPVKLLSLVTRYLNNNQRNIHLSVEQILEGNTLSGCTFDVLLLPLSHDSETITIKEATPEHAVEMVLNALSYEWSEFMDYYKQFRYAFPEKHNPVIESLEIKQRDLLTPILREKSIYVICHPRPVNLQKLFEAIQPYVLKNRSNKP